MEKNNSGNACFVGWIHSCFAGKSGFRRIEALGADLTKEQRKTVLSLLDVRENELSDYEVIEITNQDEHDYLDDYLSASVIGTKALSSVRVEKVGEEKGIRVETKNITYCTSGMYTNALTTAGVTDAEVVVAGPFGISGTAALVPRMSLSSRATLPLILEMKRQKN